MNTNYINKFQRDGQATENEGRYMPELGQAIYGQPYKEIKVPDFLESALNVIRDFMTENKMFQPHYATPFDNYGLKYKNDVFECYTYQWAECNCEDEAKCSCGYVPQLYNFKYKDIEVSWYKYLGRGMSMNRKVTKQECAELLKDCLKSLLHSDKNVDEM